MRPCTASRQRAVILAATVLRVLAATVLCAPTAQGRHAFLQHELRSSSRQRLRLFAWQRFHAPKRHVHDDHDEDDHGRCHPKAHVEPHPFRCAEHIGPDLRPVHPSFLSIVSDPSSLHPSKQSATASQVRAKAGETPVLPRKSLARGKYLHMRLAHGKGPCTRRFASTATSARRASAARPNVTTPSQQLTVPFHVSLLDAGGQRHVQQDARHQE